MGRNKYSQREIDEIGRLLELKCQGNRLQQKQVRHTLRTEYEFNIADFNEPGKPFGYEELQACLRRKAIQILDDATIASMKEKRARDRARDLERARQEAIDAGEQTDWKEALKEWEKAQNETRNNPA